MTSFTPPRTDGGLAVGIDLQEVPVAREADRRTDGGSRPQIWSPSYLALLASLGIAGGVVAFTLYSIKPFVFFPADILMWAETEFVGDIIKLRIGAPIYTAPTDNNSFVYTPAAPLLTYAISWIIGQSTSIATWRLIQVGFVTAAALLATVSCYHLYRLAFPGQPLRFRKSWLVLIFFAMFLAATEPRANAYVYSLHADALALLVSVFSFWTMLRYLESPSWKWVLLMAVCPVVGYLTKNYLLIWAAVMLIFLVLHDFRRVRHWILFSTIAASTVAIAIGLCYWLWGDPFIFWTFKVMGGVRREISLDPASFGVSLPRSADHLLRAWLELGIGVVGGWLILRAGNVRRLGPLWAGWLLLVASEVVLSGSGWGLMYYFGPGVLLGAVFLFAALPRYWPSDKAAAVAEFPLLTRWTNALVAVGAVVAIFVLMHVVPTGDRNEARYWRGGVSPDAYRYVADIEKEFEGLPPDKVLLDVGNWVYLRHSVLQRDRAIPLGDQPPAHIYENVNVMIQRLRNQTYAKILVHDFNSPFFLYDWAEWETPSGVRQALLENYTEVRVIPAPDGSTPRGIMHAGPVSVLVPKPRT